MIAHMFSRGNIMELDQQTRVTPEDLQFQNVVFDMKFHPQQDMIACGLITGDAFMYVALIFHPISGSSAQIFNDTLDSHKSCRYQYSQEANRMLYHWTFLEKSCRVVQFFQQGNGWCFFFFGSISTIVGLICGSSDCSLRAIDVTTGKLGYTCTNAHPYVIMLYLVLI